MVSWNQRIRTILKYSISQFEWTWKKINADSADATFNIVSSEHMTMSNISCFTPINIIGLGGGGQEGKVANYKSRSVNYHTAVNARMSCMPHPLTLCRRYTHACARAHTHKHREVRAHMLFTSPIRLHLICVSQLHF